MSINDYRLYGGEEPEGEEVAEEVVEEVTEEVTPEPTTEADEAAKDAEFEAEKAAATASVPTKATKKEDIRAYLMYQHGVDPSDMQDMTKDDLLSLVDDLEA